MSSNSAPGQDGLTVEHLQALFYMIKDRILCIYNSFFPCPIFL